MNHFSLQDRLFQKIRESLDNETSFADAIAEKLHISLDSAYRRIRGETPLVLDEAKELCEAYKISLDEVLTAPRHSIAFQPVRVEADNSYSFEQYLVDIVKNLTYIKSFKRYHITYVTKELPFFYDFWFRPLFSFHYYFWMKSVVEHPEFRNKKFSVGCLPPRVEQLGKEVLVNYADIPSTEICNTECINSTISQIEYYREAGYFSSKDDVVLLYDCLRQTIEHMQSQAELGCKYLPGTKPDLRRDHYRFFYNSLLFGENTILLHLDEHKTVYLNHGVLNYMFTSDQNFCNEIESRFETLKKRATLLTQTSDKQRNQFFNKLLRKIPDHTKITL
jgi:hypothetical protein